MPYKTEITYMTEEELKIHIEDISRNNTCHRPDISCYDSCNPCPFKKYCLCELNTYKFGGRRSGKRKRRAIKTK